jgi:hypothetical protein
MFFLSSGSLDLYVGLEKHETVFNFQITNGSDSFKLVFQLKVFLNIRYFKIFDFCAPTHSRH